MTLLVDRLRGNAMDGSLMWEAADEIERLRAALRELQRMGDEGMAPSYGEWLTFHAKVAKIAREALNDGQTGK